MYGCLIKVYRLLALMGVLADATRACAIPVLSDATATVWCLHWYFHTSAESQTSMLLALLLKNWFSFFELKNLGTLSIILLLSLGSTFVVHVIFNMPSLSAALCSRYLQIIFFIDCNMTRLYFGHFWEYIYIYLFFDCESSLSYVCVLPEVSNTILI